MKRNVKYLVLALIAYLAAGCVKLDTAPFDRISSETFYKTPEHAKQAIMGVYGGLRRDDAFGKKNMHDNMGGIAWGWQENGYLSFMIGTANERTAHSYNYWRHMYDGVQRANQVVRRVSEAELDAAIKGPILGEARFLRALHYLELVSYYGGVPIYDESIDLNADFNNLTKPRNTAAEVYASIISDLTQAIADLPVSWPQAEYGRATKSAAYALRGKAYLYAKEWKNAIADFEEVVYNRSHNHGHALYPDYAGLFKLIGHQSSEIIFAIQTLGGVGLNYGLPFTSYIGFRGSFGGQNFGLPATELADSYENKDGTPFDWNEYIPGFNEDSQVKRNALLATQSSGTLTSVPDTALLGDIYRGRDPRLMATIFVPYSYHLGFVGNINVRMLQFVVAQGVNENFGLARNNSGRFTYMWRKFVPEGNENGAITVREHTPFNFPLIRLGDVLLMLAESYNEDGQLEKGVVELNKVRARVGMPGLNSGPEWLQVTTKQELFDRIVHERRVELAGEGHSFSDLRRWGIAQQKLNGLVHRNLFGEVQYTRVFTERDYLWPIPGQEREMNAALEQNAGW